MSILLAENHALLRGCLQHRLSAEPGLDVVAAVASADDAIAETVRLQPDVVLMAALLPGLSCFDATRIIGARRPASRVIIMCEGPNDRHIEMAQTVLASGCVAKTETEEVIIEAIQKVVGGNTYYSPQIRERIIFNNGAAGQPVKHVSLASMLSQREVEVVLNIARGLSQKEIAHTMKISEHTVHRHTTNLMRKLHIHDRVGLARFAIREGLAQPW